MKPTKKGINTICTHYGEIEDTQFKGAVSPLFMSSSYAFDEVDIKRYPRYFNTPNQEALSKKIAALENTESALIFGSGMAAISTSLFAFLKAGDHIVLQNTLYGGTYNLINEEFEKFGIEFSFTDGFEPSDFEAKIRSNTKVIYIETPSNPLLTITNIDAIASIAKKHNLVSMIDNTFASPVNQNPIDFGIDLVMHSATKYFGGHSDICAGAVAGSKDHLDKKNKDNFEFFNLGTGIGSSVLDVIKSFERVSNKRLNYKIVNKREGDVVSAYADTKKARRTGHKDQDTIKVKEQ